VIEYSSRTPRPADVLRLLRPTAWGAVGAWSDGRLVGFARAITDGVCRSFVEDVVVEDSVRGQGVGRRLVSELLALSPDVELVALDCPSELVPFYTALGFKPSANTRMEIVRPGRG
jgi:GNAT superfamily N-acetyltransferase